MNNLFNEDFVEFIKAFNNAKVEYLLVGGYSVIIHGYYRATGDMDLWVRRSAVLSIKKGDNFRCRPGVLNCSN